MDYNGISHGDWCNARTRPSRCSACGVNVFYFWCDCGSKVFFEELGGSWPQHQCSRKLAASDKAQRRQEKAALDHEKQRLSGGRWMRTASGVSHWQQSTTDTIYLCGLALIQAAQKCDGENVCAKCENQYMKAANKWVQEERQKTTANSKKHKGKLRHGVTENTPAKGRVRLFG